MKKIVHKTGILHVETPLGIINIYTGLSDALMREVETVEMIPNQYVGERKVVVRGRRFIQLKKGYRQ